MRIALFFGSFNPVHIGHLIIAQTVAESDFVEQVWFVVSPQNPFKKKSTLLHEFDRYDMLQAAIADNELLEVTDIEFELPRPSYTIDTLIHIQERYPEAEFRLLIGEDNLKHFHKWKNYEQILKHFGLLIYPRPNTEKTDFHTQQNVQFVEAPQIEISSTYIRKRIKAQASLRYLVPDIVNQIIKEKSFYQS
ncbi:MAG: nicotinate-nucleotide adenylyltransferase [Bernardetiaceae bacterium]|nr:nicotinate-nucleotide adenylyltransferase [Bernardetiaceae bacterium]